MFEEWPVLEFLSIQQDSTLSLFSRESSEHIAEVLMREISDYVEKCGNSTSLNLHIQADGHLSWLMQVISHALTLSYTPSKEYEALHAAVKTYVLWCSALTKEPHPSVPPPLRVNPQAYTSEMLNALRVIFMRNASNTTSGGSVYQSGVTEQPDAVTSRQSREMQSVLKAVSILNSECLDDHREFVWATTLKFLLNVSDLLLAGQSSADDISTVMAPKMIQTLFDEFLRSARLKYIPSPSYWKTLSVLSKRWRHQVSLVENWARKMLSLSVLIVQQMFGTEYCSVNIVDDEVKEFRCFVCPSSSEEGEYSILHVCWFQMLHMLGSPADIVDFDPCVASAVSHNPIEAIIATGGEMDSDGRPFVKGMGEILTPYTVGRIRQCFFVASAAIAKLVDIFYGDPNVSIDFRESDELMRQWVESSRAEYDSWLRQQQMSQRSSNASMSAMDSGTLTANQSAPSGSVSGGSNILKNAFGLQSSTHSTKSRPASERSLPINATVSSLLTSAGDMPPEIAKPTSSQFVWNYLKCNRMYYPYSGDRQPKVSRMLDMFMDWLVQSALVRPTRFRTNEVYSDVTSQRSMSSLGADETIMEGTVSAGEGHTSATDSVTRHSFGASSSGDVHSGIVPPMDWPGVDGVSAGRAAAIGALCRIVCSKTSKEILVDSQLAQFYKVIHEALLEKDRLVLCSLIYYGGSVFRLGLRGVEVLLPLFVLALDIILTESTKLRLHPSINEVEMRRACLQTLSSIISWPTTFGNARISEPSHMTFSSSGQAIPEEHSTKYIELRPRIHRNLIYSLRHETDPTNLHLSLAMCNILCEESCAYDLFCEEEQILKEKKESVRKSGLDANEDKGYCVSVLRSVVSAICDNMCKPLWSFELSVCLAAIDCLNAIASLHPSVLFHSKDLSTGFLVVTSLCRFIETQLMKPPPLHSRDLHSSVVAAYSCLVVWLCSASQLVETESCLTTVAETIELGITGGKNLPVAERKSASKRVHDAAEHLLYSLFASVGQGGTTEIVDERRLLYRYGPQAIDTTKFRHFLIKKHSLLSIHEATKTLAVSQGRPSLFFVLRTPHQSAIATIAQLHANPKETDGQEGEEKENESTLSNETVSNNVNREPELLGHQFVMPPDFEKPRCKLDAVIPCLQPTPETDKMMTELNEIRKKVERGESVVRSSDERNVWLRGPISNELTKPIRPKPPPADCDAGRVFLYDMGLISEEIFKSGDIVFLNSLNSEEFYNDLHQMVDRSPTKLLQSVSVFYVRDGQRATVDILENAMNIQNTCSQFCEMLAELGDGVEVETHPHWTGNWSTAFSSERKPVTERGCVDHYILDGFSHCLWWSDAQVEVAYTMPTERCRKRGTDICDLPPTVVTSFDEQSDPEQTVSSRRLQRSTGLSNSSSSDEKSTGRASGSSGRSSSFVGDGVPIRPARSKTVSGVGSGNEANGVHGSGGPERTGSTLVKRCADQRIFVIWLERAEDMRYFPIEDMFGVTGDGSLSYGRPARPDYVAIFLNQVEDGLVRVHISGNFTKCGLPGPLFDGCVVSNCSLPSLIRLTVISIARRKTVELENYQMVYCSRRQAIQEFARKYAFKLSYTELVEKLLAY